MCDALNKITNYSMFKVLDVNLNDDTFRTKTSKKTNFDRWKIVQEELVSKSYKEKFQEITNLDYLKNRLKNNKNFIINFNYKSRVLDKEKWNSLKIIPSKKKNHLYFYVYNLDEGNLL